MQTKQLSLSTARWIALTMYFTGLVTYPLVGVLVKLPPPASPDLLRVLPMILLAVGVADYIASLVIEGIVLAQAKRTKNPSGAATAAIITAACGESLAVFGLVLTFLGAGNWGMPLYALCFVHGVHLMIRWPGFERVASGETYDSEQ